MKVFIFFLWMILTFQSLSIGPCSAETNKRPFWTKQSSFMEGEDLFVVGSAPMRPRSKRAKSKRLRMPRSN